MKSFNSEQLIDKTMRAVNSIYLNSFQYAELRSMLKARLKTVCYINSLGSEEIIIKYPDSEKVRDLSYSENRKYFKQIQKKLQTALNELDRAWGYYGEYSYGMNYGYRHIEKSSH